MNSLLILAAITSATCSVSQYEAAAFTASAHLEEEAEINRTPEWTIGAYLVLWNKAACEKLTENDDDWADDERETFINESSADMATLVWAEKSGLFGKPKHVVVLADSTGAARLRFPGYGREGKIDQVCEPAPWSFPKLPGS